MIINIPEFDSIRTLVVGDLMLDRYWHGNASRISPEAPVPIIHIKGLEERPGGAGNVALNLEALDCKSTTLLGLTGKDEPASTLKKQFKALNIDCVFHELDNAPTITKLRVMGRNQQLIRLDFEEPFSAEQAENLLPSFNQKIAETDVLILSDYGKGVAHHAQTFIKAANKAGIPVLVDPKSNDFNLYRGATVITPNQKEFEAVVGPCANQSELIAKGHQLMRTHDIHALLITQSEHGMTLLQEGADPLHLPTRARQVYDVTGAGDTVISVMAAAMAANEPLHKAAALANIAAGIVIKKLGASTVSIPELRRSIQRQEISSSGILTEEALIHAVEDAHKQGETVVMTNGCFDILHAGHVQYLEQAKELGQRLIIAVNDDDSVRRLKGNSRPINCLESRMTLLSALRAVDWVVPFSEDTPERLIKAVSPDVLVKGGDYTIPEIAGADHVLSKNGIVKILPFKDGHSTTKIIEKALGTA
jgi:D-beta-D-heptose 7-phosphate kinase/D-beta-D-heptose 1-phosphate adenosyltransferase